MPSPADANVEEKARYILDCVLAKPREFPPATGLDTYEPRGSDIIVTTFPKAGTTLTQQLVYQTVIATGGASERDQTGLDFEDICEVVPFIDFGPENGFPVCESKPRIFKSHFSANLFKTTTQKHVVVLRDPVSYPASWLDFLFDAWTPEPVTDVRVRESVFHEFVKVRILGKGGAGFGFPYEREDDPAKGSETDGKMSVGPWFLHAKSWVDAMRPGVLVLFYEDIVGNMEHAIRRVAKFMERDISEEGVKQVLDRCDRTYMSNDGKFRCTLENKALGFGENAWKAKPLDRQGFKQFKVTEEDKVEMNKRFVQEFGVAGYKELQTLINEKQSPYSV